MAFKTLLTHKYECHDGHCTLLYLCRWSFFSSILYSSHVFQASPSHGSLAANNLHRPSNCGSNATRYLQECDHHKCQAFGLLARLPPCHKVSLEISLNVDGLFCMPTFNVVVCPF